VRSKDEEEARAIDAKYDGARVHVCFECSSVAAVHVRGLIEKNVTALKEMQGTHHHWITWPLLAVSAGLTDAIEPPPPLLGPPSVIVHPPRRVTTPSTDEVVSNCAGNGGHFWTEKFGTDRFCSRCWYSPDYPEGKIAEPGDIRPVRDEPQA
jgi:hypothetical protein